MLVESPEIITNPIISIRVLVYNHEKYLKKCLDGIFMQDIDVPFEVIIGEDCSTDNSRDICIEYQKKYPMHIRLILQEKNKGLIGNYNDVCELAKGEFITGVAGDDYWCTDNKLQLQFDFMRKHPDVGLCYTNVITCNDEGVENPKPLLEASYMPKTFEDQLFKTCYMAPNTWFVRRDVFNKIEDQKSWFTDESLATALDFLHESKMALIDVVTTVYRVHAGSLAAQTDPAKKWKYEKGLFDMQLYYADKYNCSNTVILKLKMQEYASKMITALEADDNQFVEETLNFYKEHNMEMKWFVEKCKEYKEYHRQLSMIQHSKAYRLGKFLLKPLKLLKKL